MPFRATNWRGKLHELIFEAVTALGKARVQEHTAIDLLG